MTVKKGTVQHKYTDAEMLEIGRGHFLPGVNKRSQVYAYERWKVRRDTGRKLGQRVNQEPTIEYHGYEFSTGEWV